MHHHLNDDKTITKLTGDKVELMFGTTSDTGNETYFVVLIVPISEVSKILKRSFLDSSGELYLVNSDGLLITESVSFERFVQQEDIKEGSGSAIGLRISTNPKDQEAPLIKSVASVI